MSQTLHDKLTAASELGLLVKTIPESIKGNLKPKIKLRPYQETALERFLYFIEDYPQKPQSPQILFHMATGSGKTIIMASLILELFRNGYRNFLFFVNSSQIIQKTKENFLNSASSKYIFASEIHIDGKLVEIRSVENFNATSSDTINIHFTTIQALHARLVSPRENSVTIENFSSYKVALISDEAHHINAQTKKRQTLTETEALVSWEKTVKHIFDQNTENILLEFTATVDFSNEAIREKYRDKIIFDYSLRQFREDLYSKEIELRQADLKPELRMLHAVVLSQYRRKVAEAHNIHCKPVILMKSKTIAESGKHENLFNKLIKNLSGKRIEAIKNSSKNDAVLSKAFDFFFVERGIKNSELVRELKGDFAKEKLANVNNLQDLETRQIELNTLEDRSNEIRVIFAVDKLNEGWDVLNLFDIVRLYDTRDGKANKVGKTTMAEAQLIGRGARYFPFSYDTNDLEERGKRKYDKKLEDSLRILEELHYHCAHNPRYIQDITNALRSTGMVDDNARKVKIKLKDSFKKTELYKSGYFWKNRCIKNPRKNVTGLSAYKIQSRFSFPSLLTGQVTQKTAFGMSHSLNFDKSKNIVSKEFKLKEFGKFVLRFSMDKNQFFHFRCLVGYFPKLVSCDEFLNSSDYLGDVKVETRGPLKDLENLTVELKVKITTYVLQEVELAVKQNSVDFVGTTAFKAFKIKDFFIDKSLKIPLLGESALAWSDSNINDLKNIDLAEKNWFAYNDNYGTDQEKHFIKFISDNEHQIGKIYDSFYLLRNEKAFKIYDFQDGKAFEPDFVLFARKQKQQEISTFQIFVEPKGDHLVQNDQWKETFLQNLQANARFEIPLQNQDYNIIGMPFFNSEGRSYSNFKASFESLLYPFNSQKKHVN